MTINDALELLKFYNGPFELKLHPGANEALINKVENTYGIRFPDDFKTLYRFSDGFEIDEDILNMIPLAEMISNKTANEPVWIAEYMIYCDTWDLEINPHDPNDYSISVNDRDRGKITLTHSLAEFIERFLKGGVFETGGLYHWADEIKAKIYGNTNPNDMKPLLGVFSECLTLGLMSKQEVISRADWIISTEYEPDPFFTQISRSRNLNELLAVLNSINLTDDILQVRAVFGVVSLEFLRNKMTAAKALSILNKFADRKDFTAFETNEIRYLIKELEYLHNHQNKTSQIKVNDRAKAFFNNYRYFNSYHYNNWDDINGKIIEDFSAKG